MKHWRTMLILLVAAIVCVAVWQAIRPREPLFRGRKVSQWVEIYCLQPDDAKLHLAAICSLIDLGTNAVPPILKMAGRRDLPLKKLLLKIPLPDKLLKAYPATRLAAINMLTTAGTNAQAALPTLVGTSLHDSDKRVRDGAAEAVAAIQAGREAGSFPSSLPGGLTGYASARGIRLVTNTVAGVPSVSIPKRSASK